MFIIVIIQFLLYFRIFIVYRYLIVGDNNIIWQDFNIFNVLNYLIE